MEKTSVILKQCWIQANKRLWMNMQKKLYLPEEHLIVKSTMTRGLCTRRGKRMTHKVDNLLYRVHGGKIKKMA